MRLRAFIIMLAAALPGTAEMQEGTVAYEGFDYLNGGALAGGATGHGWTGAWAEAGESGHFASEWIIGPGNFPVIDGEPAGTGNHVDLNHHTGDRRITRRLSQTLGEGSGAVQHSFSFVLDCGPGPGVDYAGVELSHSAGGPVVYLGKPAGPGPANTGSLGIDIYGQGFTAANVPCSGQKFLRLHWSPNPSGPETMTLLIHDAVSGQLLGSVSRVAEIAFDQVTLVARRDLGAGGAIPAFDEIRASTGEVQSRTLTVESTGVSSGVTISITPADMLDQADGSTGFERVYADGTTVGLTAPLTSGGGTFLRWTLAGSDYSTRRNISLTMLGDQSLTAVYSQPEPVSYKLSVSATGLETGVAIVLEPSDQNGDGSGITGFTRTYAGGATVSLTAPEVSGGRRFVHWLKDGNVVAGGPSTSVTVDSAVSMTAVYVAAAVPPFSERLTGFAIKDHTISMTWIGIGGRTYQLEASPDLEQMFQPVGDAIVAEGNGALEMVFEETMDPPPPARFYRLRITTP